ncbi:hypothetical protein HFD88_007095 [Aspergillus terreus]|nr:hypothetical protein HFD88_007095 [Aspergillus terreus]
MKYALALASLVAAVSAHYTFDVLVVDGQETSSWQYIRENTRAEKYMPTKFINSPSITPLDSDFTCNEGANTNAGKTEVATVAAGSELAMKLAYGARIQHPGPAQVYMSKAPGDVKDYDGSGDWFKIYQDTVCTPGVELTEGGWCSWDKDRISFKIPASTPPGQYLVRAEHIALHGAHGGEAEFYYSCAQVEVTGSGSGEPSPVVKIPGVYAQDDEAVNFSVWGATDYPLIPGPEVWSG